MADLVKEYKPDTLEHFLVSDLVRASARLEDLKEVLHQLVAHGN